MYGDYIATLLGQHGSLWPRSWPEPMKLQIRMILKMAAHTR